MEKLTIKECIEDKLNKHILSTAQVPQINKTLYNNETLVNNQFKLTNPMDNLIREMPFENKNIQPKYNSLSDLTQSHLKKNLSENSNNSKFFIPGLSKAPLKNSLKIMELQSNNKINNKESNFIIPKLSTKINTDNNANIQNNNVHDKFIVDLRNALKVDPIILIENSKEDKLVTDDLKDKVLPRFVECDIRSILIENITQQCEIDISVLSELKMHNFKRPSSFGKILCTKYKHSLKPYVNKLMKT